MASRVSIRIDDETEKLVDELIVKFQQNSISKVTVSDVVRKAIESLHQETIVKN